ncbi:MAG TPA: IclR family transcriptional regulator [Burkholderiales bacterium]
MKRSRGEFSLTVSRALQLIGLFSPQRSELGISELSRELKLSKTAVHRLVQALELHQFLDHSPVSRKYRIGVEAFRVGSLFSRSLEREAHPYMRELVVNTGFTCYLSVLRNDVIVIMALVEGGGSPIRHSIPIGERIPVHSTAAGKAALALLDDAAVEEIIKRAGMAKATAHTHTDLRKLKADLAVIRARGYSVNWEERFIGVGSVATAIPGGIDGSIPIISVGFATSQVRREDVPALGERVAKAAKEIGRRHVRNG